MSATESSSLLERYSDRLGESVSELRRRAAGPTEQVVELIDELIGAHVHAICFENLDVVAARVRGEVRAVSVSPDEVADKLLDDGRGGYCHEHAVLIRTASPSWDWPCIRCWRASTSAPDVPNRAD